MFFFVSLRQSSAQPGTIGPDIPSISSRVDSPPNQSSKQVPRWSPSSFREYILHWDLAECVGFFRKSMCSLALFLHIPINVISILSFAMFVGIIISFLNVLCMAIVLWTLDVMRGVRLLYGKLCVACHSFNPFPI